MSNPAHSNHPRYTSKTRPVREVMTWGGIDYARLANFVKRCTDCDAAVMFGRTRDGGALSLVVLYGNEKAREYIGAYSDAQSVFDSITAWVEA